MRNKKVVGVTYHGTQKQDVYNIFFWWCQYLRNEALENLKRFLLGVRLPRTGQSLESPAFSIYKIFTELKKMGANIILKDRTAFV